MTRWHLANLPLPEAHLLGIAAALGLHWMSPAGLPGRSGVHRIAGATLVGAATWLIARSVAVAGQVDLGHPRRLVITGPYAVSRNPMYLGWTLLHLGLGLVARTSWTGLTVAVAAAWIHGEILREERTLAARFGAEFAEYRMAVPRYLPYPGRSRASR